MASWAPELPDPNAGDDLAYTEAWENRIRDEEPEGEGSAWSWAWLFVDDE